MRSLVILLLNKLVNFFLKFGFWSALLFLSIVLVFFILLTYQIMFTDPII